MRAVKLGLASILILLALVGVVYLLWSSQGDSPAGKKGWRLREAADRPGCLPAQDGVEIRTTPSGIRFVRTPEERFADLPGYDFRPNYVRMDGLRMHYVDRGPRDGPVVLLLHGQPSWSYLYRLMIPVFAEAGYRTIAVDHMGMGRSDKPVDLGIHTYDRHTEWIREFIRALDLREINLFAQDWGGIIGLRIVGQEPGLFSRVVAANTTLPVIPKGLNPFRVPNPVRIDCAQKGVRMGDHWLIRLAYSGLREKLPRPVQALIRILAFQEWINHALTVPDLTPSQVVQFGTLKDLAPDQARAYDAPYPSLIYKAAIRAFPSMIASVEKQTEQAWEGLAKFRKPFLFLGGSHDRNVGSEANQDRLVNHIPGARGQPHQRLEAHHFIQEDLGADLAKKAVAFMKAGKEG